MERILIWWINIITRDEVVLSKIFLSNFCPKQGIEWIGPFSFKISFGTYQSFPNLNLEADSGYFAYTSDFQTVWRDTFVCRKYFPVCRQKNIEFVNQTNSSQLQGYLYLAALVFSQRFLQKEICLLLMLSVSFRLIMIKSIGFQCKSIKWRKKIVCFE
jgi:hypothetical protein